MISDRLLNSTKATSVVPEVTSAATFPYSAQPEATSVVPEVTFAATFPYSAQPEATSVVPEVIFAATFPYSAQPEATSALTFVLEDYKLFFLQKPIILRMTIWETIVHYRVMRILRNEYQLWQDKNVIPVFSVRQRCV